MSAWLGMCFFCAFSWGLMYCCLSAVLCFCCIKSGSWSSFKSDLM